MLLNPIDWIIQNKQWLFDGVLVAVPLAILGWFFGKSIIKKKIQKQRGGHGSTNIQVGRDIKINKKGRDD